MTDDTGAVPQDGKSKSERVTERWWVVHYMKMPEDGPAADSRRGIDVLNGRTKIEAINKLLHTHRGGMCEYEVGHIYETRGAFTLDIAKALARGDQRERASELRRRKEEEA